MHVLYILHTFNIYSYIKFSYRHTFLVLSVRCWLHFQQGGFDTEGKSLVFSSGFLRRKKKSEAGAASPSPRPHALSPSRRSRFGRRPDTLLKAHGVQGAEFPEGEEAWRRRPASTGRGSTAGDGLWAELRGRSGAGLNPTRLGQSWGERANRSERGTARGVLCEDVRGGGNGDELAQDALGHFDIVLCNHQCFLDVLVRVALTHQVLDLAADLGVGLSTRRPAAGRRRHRRHGAGPALRVDPSGEGLGGPLRRLHGLREGCNDTHRARVRRLIEKVL